MEQRNGTAADEEKFRLNIGLNDIFVVIACTLLLSSLNWIGMEVNRWLGSTLQAVAAWILAEYFTRVRQMALPSIVLGLAFVGGVGMSGVKYLITDYPEIEISLVIPCGLAAIGAWLHWIRFQVPMTVAAGTAVLIAGFMIFLLAVMPDAKSWMYINMGVAGGIVFGLALGWDTSDLLRQTRRSDVAFWLHLLAAPLLVHPIFSSIYDLRRPLEFWQVGLAVLLYLVIALVSLSINRRALMVFGLSYVLYAFNMFLNRFGVVSLNYMFTAFTIGGGLLLLSVFWNSCRRILFRIYPHSIQIRLPPYSRLPSGFH